MSMKRSGLGRNLSALLGDSAAQYKQDQSPSILQLSIQSLQPGKYQPRKAMDDVSLEELASSIKQQGLLQPLIVRLLDNDTYEIIAGERRWRASQLAGLTLVPVIVRQVNDETAMAMALVENLQREDLNPMDQARAMAKLHEEFNLTHQQIADLLSKSRASVSNFLRLLSLSLEVMQFLENGDLDMGHARTLLMLEKDQQLQVAKMVVANNLSVRETEKLVNKIKNEKISIKTIISDFPERIKVQIDALAELLQSKIQVKNNKNGKGALVIHYNSLQALETVIQSMQGEK